jgi:hypothetical protein
LHHGDTPLRFGLALVAALCCVGLAWRESRRMAAIDFFHYWAVPQVLRTQNIANIYSLSGRQQIGAYLRDRAAAGRLDQRQGVAAEGSLKIDKGLLDTIATPFLFWVFDACSTGDYERDHFLFELVAFACFIGAILFLSRRFGHSWASALLMLALFTFLFEPFRSDLRVANVNRLQVAWLAALLALLGTSFSRGRWVGAGVLMGLGVLFKPNLCPAPVLVVVACLSRRAFGRSGLLIAGGVVGMLVGFLLPVMLFRNVGCWAQWMGVLPEVAQSQRRLVEGNFGLSSLLLRWLGVDASLPLLILTACMVLVAAWRGRHTPAGKKKSTNCEHSPMQDDGDWQHSLPVMLCLGPVLMLVSARLVWLHYYLLAVPLFLLVLQPAKGEATVREQISRRARRWTALLLFSLGGLTVLPYKVFLWPSVVNAILANLAAVAFGLACCRDLWCGRRPGQAH